MPRLIVLLRIKDGMFFLHEWLSNIEKIADEIVVVDNGSTDGTYEVLQAHPKVTEIVRTKGFNEGRDKNLVYSLARRRKPDWCLWIDVDEIFEPQLSRKNFDSLMNQPFINKYGFRRFHFIDRENFAGSLSRLNYSAGHDRIMWRESSTGYFENVIIDSPNVKGIKGLRWNTHFRIKHLGYINKEIVDKKADIYRSIIPEKESTFREMYLPNERPVKWNDNRKSIDVIKLNWHLNYLRFTHIFPRVKNKISGMLSKPSNVPAPQQTMPGFTAESMCDNAVSHHSLKTVK